MFDHDLAIVDTETTGMSPFHDRVIEIAIIRVSKNKIVDKYTTLLNPQMHISPYISMFTGISDVDLKNAPLFHDIKDRVKELLDGAVFVAHNVRFDYSFIKNELKRTGTPFRAKTFCTVRLSRRLYPEYRSHSLESVINRFNFKFKDRHRAYDDAHVLWQFIQKVKKKFPKETLLRTWSDLTKSLYSGDANIRAQVDSLPESPGVYIFYDKNDSPLYVGKSKSIVDRVIAHFSEDLSSTKHLQLMKEISRIGHIKTIGELGAMLLEAQLVKELHPPYNAQLKEKKAFVVLLKAKNKDGYLTLKTQTVKSLTEVETDDLMGTFKNERSAKEYLVEFADKYTLCKKLLGVDNCKTSCFDYKLGKCKGACVKKENKKIYNSRFLIAFIESRQYRPWPFEGPVEIMEKDAEEEERWESYIIDKWCLVGKKNSVGDELQYNPIFDPDYYRIISRHIKHNHESIKTI